MPKNSSLIKIIQRMGPFFPAGETALIILGSLVGALLEFCAAGSISLLGLSMANPEKVIHIKYIAKGISYLNLDKSLHDQTIILLLILGIVCISILMKNIFIGWLTWKSVFFSYKIAGNFCEKLFQAFLKKPLIWHLQQNASDLVTFIQWRTHISVYCNHLLSVIIQCSIIIILLIGSFYFTFIGSIIVFGGITLIGGGVYSFSRNHLLKVSIKARDTDSKINRLTYASLLGYKDIIISGKESIISQKISCLWPIQSAAYAARAVYQPLPQWILETTGIGLLLIALLVIKLLDIPYDDIISILMLLMGIAWRILPAAHKILAGILGLRSVIPMLDAMLPITEEILSSQQKGECKEKIDFCKEITFNNVCFHYPQMNSLILKNINLKIKKGTTVGFIGTSGSGKTTLINTLTGFLSPSSGSISIDNLKLNSPSRIKGWMHHIGYVPQSPYMIDATIAQNIAFNFGAEKIDEKRIIECSEMAALDFIEHLPHGFETRIGDRGTCLSGGQLQRIAIARALYKKPTILIFDEATSAMDEGHEESIRKTISALKNKMTIIMIAHRLSTLEHCDIIYWLDNGIIQKKGLPSDIIPLYRSYLEKQMNEKI